MTDRKMLIDCEAIVSASERTELPEGSTMSLIMGFAEPYDQGIAFALDLEPEDRDSFLRRMGLNRLADWVRSTAG